MPPRDVGACPGPQIGQTHETRLMELKTLPCKIISIP